MRTVIIKQTQVTQIPDMICENFWGHTLLIKLYSMSAVRRLLGCQDSWLTDRGLIQEQREQPGPDHGEQLGPDQGEHGQVTGGVLVVATFECFPQ